MNTPLVISKRFSICSPQPCQFTPLTNFCLRDKASFYKTMTKQTSKPFAVRYIRLSARNIFYVSCIILSKVIDLTLQLQKNADNHLHNYTLSSTILYYKQE